MTALLLAGVAACSSDPDDSPGAAGAFPTAGAAGQAAGGSSAGKPGANDAGRAAGGSAPITAGSGGSGVIAGASGSPGAGMSAGGSSGAASAGAGGSGGSAGAPPTAGSGGQPALKGGPSARFVCKAGATYGNPLEGMSAVTTIGPPTSGDVTYFAFIEGPIWVGSVGKLFFSDNAASPEERIWVLTPPSTMPQVFMEKSGSNGLGLDNDDKLLVCEQRGKRITRVDPTSGSPMNETIASTGTAKPNDLIMRSDGNIYFTDPDAQRGFYRVSPTGMVSGPMTQVSNPNGIALSPDENTLYVGDVQNRTITAFPVAADGTVDGAGMKPFATATNYTLDGMAVDCAGNVYGATGLGVEVFSPAGMPIGIVPTGESSNATFGGPDRKTLYVTSRATLKAVTLAVPGLPN